MTTDICEVTLLLFCHLCSDKVLQQSQSHNINTFCKKEKMYWVQKNVVLACVCVWFPMDIWHEADSPVCPGWMAPVWARWCCCPPPCSDGLCKAECGADCSRGRWVWTGVHPLSFQTPQGNTSEKKQKACVIYFYVKKCIDICCFELFLHLPFHAIFSPCFSSLPGEVGHPLSDVAD